MAPDNDAADFDAAFSPDPVDAGGGADAGSDAGSDAGPARDEHGRFAGQAEGGEGAGDKGGNDKDIGRGHFIPLAEHLSEREKRQAAERRAEDYERRLADLERQRQSTEQDDPPDMLADPDGYRAYLDETVSGRVKNVEQLVHARFIDMTLADQVEANGKEAVDKAVDDFVASVGKGGSKDPTTFAQVTRAPNPGKALMRWHRQRAAMSEIGDDLDGYKKKLRDQFLDDPEFRKSAMERWRDQANGGGGSGGYGSSNVTDLPSLNRTPGGAGRQNTGDLGETESEVFQNAFARPARR